MNIYTEKLSPYVPDGWGRNESGGMSVLESKRGKVISIYFDIDLDTIYRDTSTIPGSEKADEEEPGWRNISFRSHLRESGYDIPQNIKNLRIISLSPEEMLPITDRLSPACKNKNATGLINGVAATTSNYGHTTPLARQPMEHLESSLGRIFTRDRAGAKEKNRFFASLSQRCGNKTTLVIIDAHGGGEDFSLGDQYRIPVLKRSDGTYIKAEHYPYNWMDNSNGSVAHPDFSTGNEIAAQDIVDMFDNQDSEIAGIIFLACNEDRAKLKAKHTSLAYTQGFAGILESYKRDNRLEVVV